MRNEINVIILGQNVLAENISGTKKALYCDIASGRLNDMLVVVSFSDALMKAMQMKRWSYHHSADDTVV